MTVVLWWLYFESYNRSSNVLGGRGSLRTFFSQNYQSYFCCFYDCLISAFRLPDQAFYSGHHYDRTFFANNFSGLGLSYLGFRDSNLRLRDQLSASQRYLFSRHRLLCSHRLVHPRMTVVASCNISTPIGDASPDKNVNKVRCHVVTCSRVTCYVLYNLGKKEQLGPRSGAFWQIFAHTVTSFTKTN